MAKIDKHPIFVSVIAFSRGALFTIKREYEPYKDFYQLPEGSVKRGETLEQAAHRILKEVSELDAQKLKLIGIYSDVDTGERRISNTRSYIISFVALNWTGEVPLEGCRWMSDWRSEQLAWEHNEMVAEAEQVIEMASKSRLLYAVR